MLLITTSVVKLTTIITKKHPQIRTQVQIRYSIFNEMGKITKILFISYQFVCYNNYHNYVVPDQKLNQAPLQAMTPI